jgi:hypothetical protein
VLHTDKKSTFALALLAATMLTPPGPAQAAPGDALGDEFIVNTYTTSSQSEAAVAMDGDGDFVVVWTGPLAGTTDTQIFAQRFDAAGVAQGTEFQVSTSTMNGDWSPSVAMDADGDFVVAWVSYEQNGEKSSIFARRFDATGAAQGAEFQVNSYTTGFQDRPAVATDADGDFVVAWQSYGQDGHDWGVFAQRFDATGVAQGLEVQVNSYTTGMQLRSAVAMDADGNFAVVWQSEDRDGSPSGISGQRFDAAGTRQGPEFLVNSVTVGSQRDSTVAMAADGDFVVAWGDSFNIVARRFDSAGVAQGADFEVSTYWSTAQRTPAVAMDADGDFIVAWESENQDGHYHGIFARRFDAAGAAQGGEFNVNSYTSWSQRFPAVAMDADGDFVVAWRSAFQDGSNDGIVARRGQGDGPVAGDFTVDGRADILWRNGTTGAALLWQMDGFETEATGSIGGASTDWQIRALADFDADTKTDILWRNTASGAALIWLMDGFLRRELGGIGPA